jgi:hypothetical protein
MCCQKHRSRLQKNASKISNCGNWKEGQLREWQVAKWIEDVYDAEIESLIDF